MKRLLISIILSLGVHAILLGTECAWLKQISVAGPRPGTMTIALTLRQTPEPPKASLQIKPDIPLPRPDPIKQPAQKSKTKQSRPKPLKAEQEPVQAALSETAKIVNPQMPPPSESQRTNFHESSESTASAGEKVPAAHVIQKIRPFYRNHPAPTYPRIARIRGYQGNVILEVLVDRDGNVSDLRVLTSSGYPILDKAAESAVRNWSFEPGLIGKDKVAMWVRIPIRFELK